MQAMAIKQVTVRMDEDLKKETQQTLKKMGLDFSTAITLFSKAVVQQQRIPFEITADPFYSEKNQAILKESIAQLEKGETVSKSIDDLERMAQ